MVIWVMGIAFIVIGVIGLSVLSAHWWAGWYLVSFGIVGVINGVFASINTQEAAISSLRLAAASALFLSIPGSVVVLIHAAAMAYEQNHRLSGFAVALTVTLTLGGLAYTVRGVNFVLWALLLSAAVLAVTLGVRLVVPARTNHIPEHYH